MSTKMKMNGPQSDILKGSVSIMAMAKTLEGQMLTMADQIGQALAEDLVNSDHGSDRLSQDVMLAFGALEEMVESFVEALDEKVEHYDGDDQVEITEEGRRALSCDEDGNIRIPLSKDAAEEVSRYLRKINDQANYDRARGADLYPVEKLQGKAFNRITAAEISKATGIDDAKLEDVLARIIPVADFEGEMIYATEDVVKSFIAASIDMDEAFPWSIGVIEAHMPHPVGCDENGRPPYFNPGKRLGSCTHGMVSVNDLAQKLSLGFTTVKDALEDGGVPALAFSDGKAFYSLEVAMAALRKSPIGERISKLESLQVNPNSTMEEECARRGIDWMKAKNLFEVVGLNS